MRGHRDDKRRFGGDAAPALPRGGDSSIVATGARRDSLPGSPTAMNLKKLTFTLAAALALAGCSRGPQPDVVAAADPAPVTDAETALTRLRGGNARYRAGHNLEIPDMDKRRAALTRGQHPSAVIITCSDSRVPPELIFNATLGELFVIRTAGEVVADIELGSVEYAVDHLDTKLIVVLGHTSCGAVSAACEHPHATGHVNALVEAIHPAVEATQNTPGDKFHVATIDENARMIARRIASSEPLKKQIAEHKARVVAARYDIATGEVIWL